MVKVQQTTTPSFITSFIRIICNDLIHTIKLITVSMCFMVSQTAHEPEMANKVISLLKKTKVDLNVKQPNCESQMSLFLVSAQSHSSCMTPCSTIVIYLKRNAATFILYYIMKKIVLTKLSAFGKRGHYMPAVYGQDLQEEVKDEEEEAFGQEQKAPILFPPLFFLSLSFLIPPLPCIIRKVGLPG